MEGGGTQRQSDDGTRCRSEGEGQGEGSEGRVGGYRFEGRREGGWKGLRERVGRRMGNAE